METAKGHATPPAHSSGRMHVLIALVLAVLTIIAFVGAGTGMLAGPLLVPGLLILAAVQVALQVLFYMRLRWDSHMFMMFFFAGLGLAVVIALLVQTLVVL